ncbi:MAG: hypothetical protein WBQ61_27155 [Candidatus Acidiferrum sp.]
MADQTEIIESLLRVINTVARTANGWVMCCKHTFGKVRASSPSWEIPLELVTEFEKKNPELKEGWNQRFYGCDVCLQKAELICKLLSPPRQEDVPVKNVVR